MALDTIHAHCINHQSSIITTVLHITAQHTTRLDHVDCRRQHRHGSGERLQQGRYYGGINDVEPVVATAGASERRGLYARTLANVLLASLSLFIYAPVAQLRHQEPARLFATRVLLYH